MRHFSGNSRSGTPSPLRFVRGAPRALALLLLVTLLAACGRSTPPAVEALPSEEGNFEITVVPSDSEAQLTSESGAILLLELEEGRNRFLLEPGTYLLEVSRDGFEPWEEELEIPEATTQAGDADVVSKSITLGEAPADAEGDDSSQRKPAEPGDGGDEGDEGDEGDGADEPGDDEGPGDDEPEQPGGRRHLSLRGDPGFDRSELNGEQRRWYDRLWAAARNPNAEMDPRSLARSDDAYHYGRALYTHHESLLLGLRATGDLGFLDEVDKYAQVMYDQLYDGWCSSVSGSVDSGAYGVVRGEDGFLNFRRRYDSGWTHCRDAADLEESMVHGHIALIMYAYHVNRDLPSPDGIDYGQRADQWLDYLVNHFEAKWRSRKGVASDDMDFINIRFCHTWAMMTMFHYYVGERLADDGDPRASLYTERARVMTDQVFDRPYEPNRRSGGFMDTSTPLGDAVVYSFGSPGWRQDPGSTNLEACPSTYMRYMVSAQTQLALDGFYRWDDTIMTKIATGIAHFVMDTDDMKASRPFAAGVTGSRTVEDIPRTVYRDRLTLTTFALSTIANVLPWDASGRVEEITLKAYEAVEGNVDNPRRVQLPASFLLKASY